jgi:hypothetical protein
MINVEFFHNIIFYFKTISMELRKYIKLDFILAHMGFPISLKR